LASKYLIVKAAIRKFEVNVACGSVFHIQFQIHTVGHFQTVTE